MININNCIFSGNGSLINTHQSTKSGSVYTRLTMCVNLYRKDKEDDKLWLNVYVSGKTGESIYNRYRDCFKGSYVTVVGRITKPSIYQNPKTKEWETTTTILADRVAVNPKHDSSFWKDRQQNWEAKLAQEDQLLHKENDVSEVDQLPFSETNE